MESDDLISGAKLEGYIRDGGSSDHEEEDLEEGAELREYARSLGLDPHLDRDLLWVAKEAFTAPLPTGWTDHVDSEGRLYFCNQVTQESSWFHPTDLVFQEIIELVKALRSEHPPPTEARRSAALHDHLVLAHRDAQAAPGEGARGLDLVSAISEFVEDASRKALELPLGLSADQRKRAKALVEQHSGFKCESYGFGAERRIHIFRENGAPKDKHELPSRVVEEDHAENVEFTFGPTDNLEIPKVGD